MSSTSPLTSPTNTAPPTVINCATIPVNGSSGGGSKFGGNRTPFFCRETTSATLHSPMRTIVAALFAVLVGVLCIVTVRHLAGAGSVAVPPTVSSASLPPPATLQQQLAIPPTAAIADQLDALRFRFAQLQSAISDLQQQRQQLQSTSDSFSENADQLREMLNQQEPSQQQQPQVWPFYQRQMARRAMAWQPMKKRIVSWQPMKRGASWQPVKRAESGGGTVIERNREQVVLAIEDQLMEVLQAGERLGVSADEILAHLRARNAWLMEP